MRALLLLLLQLRAAFAGNLTMVPTPAPGSACAPAPPSDATSFYDCIVDNAPRKGNGFDNAAATRCLCALPDFCPFMGMCDAPLFDLPMFATNCRKGGDANAKDALVKAPAFCRVSFMTLGNSYGGTCCATEYEDNHDQSATRVPVPRKGKPTPAPVVPATPPPVPPTPPLPPSMPPVLPPTYPPSPPVLPPTTPSTSSSSSPPPTTPTTPSQGGQTTLNPTVAGRTSGKTSEPTHNDDEGGGGYVKPPPPSSSTSIGTIIGVAFGTGFVSFLAASLFVLGLSRYRKRRQSTDTTGSASSTPPRRRRERRTRSGNLRRRPSNTSSIITAEVVNDRASRGDRGNDEDDDDDDDDNNDDSPGGPSAQMLLIEGICEGAEENLMFEIETTRTEILCKAASAPPLSDEPEEQEFSPSSTVLRIFGRAPLEKQPSAPPQSELENSDVESPPPASYSSESSSPHASRATVAVVPPPQSPNHAMAESENRGVLSKHKGLVALFIIAEELSLASEENAKVIDLLIRRVTAMTSARDFFIALQQICGADTVASIANRLKADGWTPEQMSRAQMKLKERFILTRSVQVNCLEPATRNEASVTLPPPPSSEVPIIQSIPDAPQSIDQEVENLPQAPTHSVRIIENDRYDDRLEGGEMILV